MRHDSARFSNPYFVNWQSPVVMTHGLNRGLRLWYLCSPWNGVNDGTPSSVTMNNLLRGFQGTSTAATKLYGSNGAVPSLGYPPRPGGWGALYPAASGTGGLTIPSSYFPSLTKGTFAFWVLYDSQNQPLLLTGKYGNCLGKTNSASSSYNNFLITLSTTNPTTAKFQWNPYSSSASPTATSTTSPGAATWHHLCVTTTSGSHVLYVDGVQEDSGATTGTYNSGVHSMYWGCYPNSSVPTWMYGMVDDFRFYDRILNSEEVSVLYRESRTFYPSLLRRWWRPVYIPPDAPPITADASMTQAGQSATAASAVAISAAFSKTQSSNDWNLAGTVGDAAALAVTQAGQSVTGRFQVGTPHVDTYSTAGSGTYTVTGTTTITVEVYGAGSDGADPVLAGGGTGGYGGHGGAYSQAVLSVTPGDQFDYIVGDHGTVAGDSSFRITGGGTMKALAKGGGDAYVGGPGLASGGTGDVKYSGGAGATASGTGNDDGGGGGGGATSSGDGMAASGRTGGSFGGGTGGAQSAGSGTAGTAPGGGGGGGAYLSGHGAAGAVGRVVVSYLEVISYLNVSATQAGNSLSAAATVLVGGVFSKTQSGDSLSTAAGVLNLAAFSKTQSGDSLSAAGAVDPRDFTANLTQAGQSIVSAMSHPVIAAFANAQGGNATSATFTVAGEFALTSSQADDSVSAGMTSTIVGNFGQGQDPQVSAATASVSLTFSATVSQNSQGLSAAASHPVLAALAKTQSGQTLAGVASGAVRASLAETQGGQSVSAAASHAVRAALTKTQGGQSLAASGGGVTTLSLAKSQASQTLASTVGAAAKLSLARTQGGHSVLAAAMHLPFSPQKSRIFKSRIFRSRIFGMPVRPPA